MDTFTLAQLKAAKPVARQIYRIRTGPEPGEVRALAADACKLHELPESDVDAVEALARFLLEERRHAAVIALENLRDIGETFAELVVPR